MAVPIWRYALHDRVSRSNVPREWKKLYRIYREEGLTVRKRPSRRCDVSTARQWAVANGLWAPERRSLPDRRLQRNLPRGAIPQGPNQRWSLDFVSDSLSCGRRLRILNVIDDPLVTLPRNTLSGEGINRECLAAVVDTSLSGDRVGRELDRIAEMRGSPCMVVSPSRDIAVQCPARQGTTAQN